MKIYCSNPEDELGQEEGQYHGDNNSYNGSDDKEGGDFEQSYNGGFYGDFDDNNNDD